MPGAGPAYGWVDGTTPAINAAHLEAMRDDRLQCIVDTPENHGAARDGTTDDTAAINSAITAVITAGQANGSNYGEIWLSAGRYAIKGALDHTQGGNAQIPLPPISSTGQKFCLVLRCPDAAAPFPHWQQTSIQKAGTVLDSNLTGSYSGSFGSPAVIGGPTPEQGYTIPSGTDAGFSNMMFKIAGSLEINLPANPSVNALDLQAIAQMDIDAYFANASVIPGSLSAPTAGGGAAIRCPQGGNNDNCRIGSLSIEGFSVGMDPGEHLWIDRAAIVYCSSGIWFQGAAGYSVSIGSLSTEACKYHIDAKDVSAGGAIEYCVLDIQSWDIEDDDPTGDHRCQTTYHVADVNNHLRGGASLIVNDTVNFVYPQTPIVNGATNFRIVNKGVARGHATAPSIPATTTPLQNPFWRDAAVTITSGTVTVIAVDGTATGLTSTNHTVIVPSGKTITLTYSVAPSWNWVLL